MYIIGNINMAKNSVLSIIKEWILESNNPRNDGWVQEHYRNKLEEVSALIKSHKNIYEDTIIQESMGYNSLEFIQE